MRDIHGNQCLTGDVVAWPGRQGRHVYLMKGKITGWSLGGDVVEITCIPSGVVTHKEHAYYDFAKLIV